MRLLWILCFLVSTAASAQPAEFPTHNRDGKQYISVIGRECYMPTYNDKVFYIDPAGNAPHFLFPDYGQINVNIGGCTFGSKWMNWVVEYKVDAMSNVRTYTVNPTVGDQTKTIVVISHNSRRTQCIAGGTTHEYTNIKSFTIKFETPEFKGLEELKEVCSTVDKEFSLPDLFPVKEGVTFYLDNVNSSPITLINPKNLLPGFHKLYARKVYDNGTPDPTYGSRPGIVTVEYEFLVIEGIEIKVDPYPPTMCQNSPAYPVKVTPTGGTWEGRGMDAGGNFSPAIANIGRNLPVYKITSPSGCQASATLEIFVNAPPVITAPDMEICQTAPAFQLTNATPAGGNYSGRGIVGGSHFDPAQALVGRNTIRYTYTNTTTGCTAWQDFTIDVLDAGSFNVGEDFTTCNTSTDIALNDRTGVYPGDGLISWAGPGVVGGKYFSPSVAGTGNHSLTGTLYIPETGCTYTKTVVVTVLQGPAVTAGPDLHVCQNSEAFLITGGTAGGSWSGEHISSNIFTPDRALPGAYIATITVNQGSCVVKSAKTIHVYAPPLISLGPDLTVCRNAGAMRLPVPSHPGGTWSADGNYYDAAAGTLDPLRMKIGTNVITYTFTEGVCTVSKQLIVTVTLPPLADAGPDLQACVNASPVTLPGEAAGWSGPGVDGGRFLPSRAGIGEHQLTYLVTDPVTLCQNTDVMYIRVDAAPVVDAGPDLVVCKNTAEVFITGGTGGIWSGPFTDNGYFRAGNAPAGSYTLTLSYTHPITGCVGTDTRVLQLVAPPTLSLGPDLAVCRNAGAMRLPVPSHPGGTWSADGNYYDAAAGTLDPLRMKIGTNVITYTFTEGVCTVSKQLIVTVTLPPLADAGPDLQACVNASPVTLPGEAAGWSGPGVDGGRFLPSRAGIGEHQLTYLVTDPVTLCQNTDVMYIRVDAAPVVDAGPDIVVCRAGGDVYLSGVGSWSGPFTDNGYFRIGSAPLGSYILTLTYTNPSTGCTGTDTRVLQLVDAPAISIGPDIAVCEGAAKFAPPSPSLGGGTWFTPAGGFYDPVNGTLDPAKMLSGSNLLIYTFTTAAGCAIKDTIIITKQPRPVVAAMRDFTACYNGAAIALQGQPEAVGTWDGPGVNNNAGHFFLPAEAGAGRHLLYFRVSDPVTGCRNEDSTIVTVYGLPTLVMPADSSICVASPSFPVRLLPGGGILEGSAGITGVNFDPGKAGIGTHKLTYKVTDPSTRCSNTGTVTFQVKGLPGAIIIGGDTTACKGATVQIFAAAENVTSFDWYRNNEGQPFASGPSIHYTIRQDEQLIVKPKPVNPGDCPGPSRQVRITSNTPQGEIRYSGSDTLDYGALFQAAAAVQKANAYRWDFGDGGHSTQPDGNHYYYTPGRHSITMLATGAGGCSALFSLPPLFVRSENGDVPGGDFGRGDGMDQGGAGLNVYPTTFSTRITVELVLKAPQPVGIEFYDFGGRKVAEVRRDGVAGRNKFEIGEAGRLQGHGVWFFVKITSPEISKTVSIFKL